MDLEELFGKLDDRAAEREATREKTRPKSMPLPPVSGWKKVGLIAGAVIAAFGAATLVWAFLGDTVIIPRAEAVKVHREQGARLDKHERAIRYQTEVSSTMNENLVTIGNERGLPMKALPQPDLLADE